MKTDRNRPVAGALMATLFVTFGALAEMPTPVLWYAAEEGVTTDANDNVTKWANKGSLGTAGDLVPNGSASSIKAVRNSTLAGYRAVGFTGNTKCSNFLTTSGEISLGASKSTGLTWFYVCDALANTWTYRTVLFGLDRSKAYLSALYLFDVDSGVLRSEILNGGDYVDFDREGAAAGKPGRRLLSLVGNGSKICGFVAGGPSGTPANWGYDTAQTAAKFMLGADLSHTAYFDFAGHVGEFRLYNTALTAAERFAVEGELAARHHFALAPDSVTEISAALLKKHANDPAAVGDAPNGGKTVASAPTSATSGGLTVTLTSVPAASDNSLVYFAHDGGTGFARSWCVAGASDARAIPLKLSFSGSGSGLDGACLRRRDDADSPWTTVEGAVFARTATAYEFTLPANWKNGQYALAKGSALAAETILDTTVSDDNWDTTGYANAMPVTEFAETTSVESTVRLVYPTAVLQVFDSFRIGGFFTVE